MSEGIREVLVKEKDEAVKILSSKTVKREISLGKSLENNLVKVIIGPRRAGKSYFSLQSINDKRFAYVNFDDEKLLKTSDYEEYIKNLKEVYGKFELLLLDEVQNLSRWELFVNRLQREGYNLIVTGSNSNLLSTELATHLTGRHLQISVFTFSLSEFMKAKNYLFDTNKTQLKSVQGEILNLTSEYIKKGGYPEITVNESIDRNNYITTLVDSIIIKDIVRRHRIRYSNAIYNIIRYLISAFASEFSYNSVAKASGLASVHTAEKYVAYIQEAFLVFALDRFSFKAKEQIKSPKKLYVIDNGIIDAFALEPMLEQRRLMENSVAIELMRRSNDFTKFKVFYWKDSTAEVDFVIKEGIKIKQLIQVTYSVENEKTKKREVKAILKASDNLRCNDLVILTWDYEKTEEYDGKKIKFIPLYKWLLL